MGTPSRIPPTRLHQLRETVINNPALTYSEYLKKYPFMERTVNRNAFSHFKARYLMEVNKTNPNTRPRRKKVLFTSIWQYKTDEFEKNPKKALFNFLQVLSDNNKSGFEMVEIKLTEDAGKTWVSHLEIRQS